MSDDLEESTPAPTIPKLLSREQAAEYIQSIIGIRTTTTMLANWASNNSGPKYKIWRGRGTGRGGRGRYAVYEQANLDSWIESNLIEPTNQGRAGSKKSRKTSSDSDTESLQTIL